MQMRSLTKERVEELQKRYADKQVELATLEAKTPTMLWTSELGNLKSFLIKQKQSMDKALKKELLSSKSSKGKSNASSNKKKKWL